MPNPLLETSVPIRVRYAECDPQGVAHHSVYAVWLEEARTELLRAQGFVYAELERDGVYAVIAKLSVRYRRPAFYDDELGVDVRVAVARGVKVEHAYKVRRGTDVLAEAATTLVFVDGDGAVQRVPAELPGV